MISKFMDRSTCWHPYIFYSLRCIEV